MVVLIIKKLLRKLCQNSVLQLLIRSNCCIPQLFLLQKLIHPSFSNRIYFFILVGTVAAFFEKNELFLFFGAAKSKDK